MCVCLFSFFHFLTGNSISNAFHHEDIQTLNFHLEHPQDLKKKIRELQSTSPDLPSTVFLAAAKVSLKKLLCFWWVSLDAVSLGDCMSKAEEEKPHWPTCKSTGVCLDHCPDQPLTWTKVASPPGFSLYLSNRSYTGSSFPNLLCTKVQI